MGRDPVLIPSPARRPSRVASLLLLSLALALAPIATSTSMAAAAAEPTPPEDPSPFRLRVMRVGGPLDDPAVAEHVRFSAAIGFNGLWIPGERAGSWFADDGDEGELPRLDPAFETLLAAARKLGLRPWVAVNPVVESRGSYVFARREHRKRLRRWLRLLEREAGVDAFVISFHGAPLRHSELQDLLEYGLPSAPAHVELAAAARARLRRTSELWLEPAVANDLLLDDERLRYSPALLEALPALDPSVGLVWAGPSALPATVTGAELAGSRERLGGRRLLLQDRFPANHGGGRMATALVLAPLRGRDAAVAHQVAGYVACPMEQLGASRLSLLTVADYLRDPDSYDAETSWERAMDRLAGDDAAARRALSTQALEWGGFIGERNYHTARTDNPRTAAESLRDPAASAMWRWPARRYEERMAALARLADRPFAEELLAVMARREAIARAVPAVREIRARIAAGRSDFDPLLEQLQLERRRADADPGALVALDRFLVFSGVGVLLGLPETDAEPDESTESTGFDEPSASR
jgi:hypothetical protein